VNVLDTLPQKLQGEGRALLTQIPYAETREEAERPEVRVVQQSLDHPDVCSLAQQVRREGMPEPMRQAVRQSAVYSSLVL